MSVLGVALPEAELHKDPSVSTHGGEIRWASEQRGTEAYMACGSERLSL